MSVHEHERKKKTNMDKETNNTNINIDYENLQINTRWFKDSVGTYGQIFDSHSRGM